MINLLLSIGIALLAMALGWVVAGTWIAGLFPAVLAFGIAYFLLARRTGRQLEDVMKRAMKEMEAGKVERGKKILDSGFALQRWQFLIAAQIHAQLGGIEYMQQHYKEARVHLEKAWTRNWMAQAMLAALDFRDDRKPEALARLEKAKGPAGNEPLFWGLYAWMANESGDRERAIRVADEGLKKSPSSEALTEMLDALRNKKRVRVKPFGQQWYQFFPEHMSRQEMQALAQQMQAKRPGFRPPPPRR